MHTNAQRPRVAAVSFLNSKPLLDGLERDAEVRLEIPSRLVDVLAGGMCDVALLPVADIPKIPGARVVTWEGEGAGIACEGETLTVRIFSDRPLRELSVLYCDTDSHTSVQLARVVLRERYGVSPEFRALGKVFPAGEGVLLIGDKVITSPPDGDRFGYQHDLGREWNEMTGLPFVFAVWTARAGIETGVVGGLLRDAMRRGLSRRRALAEEFAPRHGWPVETAVKYFTEYLRYPLGEREFEGMRRFWELAGPAAGRPSTCA